jgi:hypothetical protein
MVTEWLTDECPQPRWVAYSSSKYWASWKAMSTPSRRS